MESRGQLLFIVYMEHAVSKCLLLADQDSKEWEAKIASYLHAMEKCGYYPLTSKEVKLLISDYIRRNGIITRFKDDYPSWKGLVPRI